MSLETAWQDEKWMSPAEKSSNDIGDKIVRSDRQLVDLVLSGDEAAFEELFERHKRLVASVALRYFRGGEHVEEVIQVAFAKMYFDLKSFRGAHDLSMPGWLSKITTNVCLDIFRQQKRRQEDPAAEISDSVQLHSATALKPSKDGEALHIERDLADKLLSRLGAEDRLLLELLYLDEMSVSEVSNILGWSQSKTKVRAWRARNILRKVVKKLV